MDVGCSKQRPWIRLAASGYSPENGASPSRPPCNVQCTGAQPAKDMGVVRSRATGDDGSPFQRVSLFTRRPQCTCLLHGRYHMYLCTDKIDCSEVGQRQACPANLEALSMQVVKVPGRYAMFKFGRRRLLCLRFRARRTEPLKH